MGAVLTQLEVIALAAILFVRPGFAVAPPTAPPHELYGFLLEQNQAAFNCTLGMPFNTGNTSDGLAYRAYMIPGTKASYLVAVFNKDRVVTLELTGDDYRGSTGFFGVTLGEDASEIESVLGKPTEIRHEADIDVDFWDYKPGNYSLEFNTHHKLYSIQVVNGQPRKPSAFAGSSEVRRYALAIQAADVDTMMQMSSGSLECTHASALSFERAARTELTDPKGKLMGCLKRAAETILSLGPDMSGTDDQLRLTPETGKTFCVTKFAGASPLREVVFAWEVDAWRVYEVTFR